MSLNCQNMIIRQEIDQSQASQPPGITASGWGLSANMENQLMRRRKGKGVRLQSHSNYIYIIPTLYKYNVDNNK